MRTISVTQYRNGKRKAVRLEWPEGLIFQDFIKHHEYRPMTLYESLAAPDYRWLSVAVFTKSDHLHFMIWIQYGGFLTECIVTNSVLDYAAIMKKLNSVELLSETHAKEESYLFYDEEYDEVIGF